MNKNMIIGLIVIIIGNVVTFLFWKYILALLAGVICWAIINNMIGALWGVRVAVKRVGWKKVWENAEAAIKGFMAPIMGRNYIYLYGHKITYVNRMVYPWRIKIDDAQYLLKPNENELLTLWGESLGNPDTFVKNLK